MIAGEYQPPRVHAIAHALNQRLGNVGKTVIYTDRVEANPTDEAASLAELVADMRAGSVETLLILGGNPVYDAPVELNFLDALRKVNLRAHVGLYENETAAWCHWHVPEAHYLESWSDARAWDGTASIVQPLIEPMYHGRTYHDVLNVLNKKADRSSHDTVQDYWKTQHKGKDFDDFWQISLHNGVVAGTAFPEKTPPAPKIPEPSPAAGPGLEIVFRPDPAVGDGAFSNNAWLQELPKPPNKMTWDNAVWISPRTAERLGIATGDVVELSLEGRKLRGPCWVQPGQADESLTVHFGYGRTRSGRVSNGIGFNAYALRTAERAGAKSRRRSHARLRRIRFRKHAAYADHGGARSAPRGHHRRISPESRVCDAGGEARASGHDDVSPVALSGSQVGHVHRPDRLHRLQRVHGCLPVREQHRRGRQGASGHGTAHELDSRGSLFLRQSG